VVEFPDRLGSLLSWIGRETQLSSMVKFPETRVSSMVEFPKRLGSLPWLNSQSLGSLSWLNSQRDSGPLRLKRARCHTIVLYSQYYVFYYYWNLFSTFFFCFLLLSRGEDVTEFQPPPDYILMADCIYYEEVSEDFAKPVWKSSLGRARVSSEKYSSQYCACVWVPIV